MPLDIFQTFDIDSLSASISARFLVPSTLRRVVAASRWVEWLRVKKVKGCLYFRKFTICGISKPYQGYEVWGNGVLPPPLIGPLSLVPP